MVRAIVLAGVCAVALGGCSTLDQLIRPDPYASTEAQASAVYIPAHLVGSDKADGDTAKDAAKNAGGDTANDTDTTKAAAPSLVSPERIFWFLAGR